MNPNSYLEREIQTEGVEEIRERQLRDFVFMVLQVRVLNKIGLVKDLRNEAVFSGSHMEPNHVEMSAVLRGIIENELNEMGIEGIHDLNDIFVKMENAYTEENEEINSLVEGIADDFLQFEWDPRIAEYLQRKGIEMKNLMQKG